MKQITDNGGSITTHDYLNAFFYKDGTLEHFSHEEGRVVKEESGGTFAYEYFLKDHLGNTRVSFDATGTILQTDHYYPFGMRMGGSLANQTGVENRYRYNGKELHTELNLGWYDYGFRWYDPAVARFVSVDPLAEKFHFLTTYQYASNTPVWAIDLDGLEGIVTSPGISVPLTLGRATPAFPVTNPTPTIGLNVPSGLANEHPAVQQALLEEWYSQAPEGMFAPGQNSSTKESGTVINVDDPVVLPVPEAVSDATQTGILRPLDGGAVQSEGGDSPGYAPERALPRDEHGNPIPEEGAQGPHTQLGQRQGRRETYRQGREFDENGQPVKDIDFTDHGRPGNHTNPHEHRYIPNETGGTPRRGPAQPLKVD